ncbi:MAG TPA: hypothetical protein VGL15_04020 [Vicinamibacteria bacterium]|jgi:hypothetical protein
MSPFHGRWRRKTSLLAAGALDEAESAATLTHLGGCADCRARLEATRRALAVLGEDPVLSMEPRLALPALVARVQARLDSPPRAALRWPLPLAAVAVMMMAFLITWLRPPAPAPARPTPSGASAAFDPTMLRRMERNMAREQAVRYLNEAQDVLVTVAAAPQKCARGPRRVDVGDEARRSRELLARRALMVDLHESEVASAGPVLDDVENMLREVAALSSCARAEDLQAITREMERRRLLMKIDLMTRELAD